MNSFSLPPREIFGVSHLVMAVKEIQDGEKLLSPLGYQTYGEILRAENPKKKSLFIFGNLAKTFSMRLLVHPRGYSSVELLVENVNENQEVTDRPPGFELQWDSLRLMIHTCSLDKTLPFWKILGFQPQRVEPDAADLKIGGVMPSNRLNVCIIADRKEVSKNYLNQRGIVCLSFLCQDVFRIREVLSREDYFVSECFRLKPFETPFYILFARNHSGEIYEFLSVDRQSNGRKRTDA